MSDPPEKAVAWLLASNEPAIRGMARRDLLDEPDPPDPRRVMEGPIVRALLAGQEPNGGFGVHPYRKWTGAHWRLVSLVELEIPAGEPRAMAALETVLDWLADPQARGNVPAPGRWGDPVACLDGGQCAGRGLPTGHGRGTSTDG